MLIIKKYAFLFLTAFVFYSSISSVTFAMGMGDGPFSGDNRTKVAANKRHNWVDNNPHGGGDYGKILECKACGREENSGSLNLDYLVCDKVMRPASYYKPDSGICSIM